MNAIVGMWDLQAVSGRFLQEIEGMKMNFLEFDEGWAACFYPCGVALIV